jgi:ketosteroid isomerase-like protein
MAAGKLDAAMTLYSPDAEVILPGQSPVKGTIAIRQWWADTLKEYEFQVSPHLVEATDIGDAVVLQGKAVGKLVARSGSGSVDIDSWFVQIYRKQPNGSYLFWRGASGPNPK